MGKLSTLLTTCLLAPLALANPHQLHASPRVAEPRVEAIRNGGIVSPRGSSPLVTRVPGAPMMRRNGLVARTEKKSLSLEQSLLDQPLFNSEWLELPGPKVELVCHKCCSKGVIDATFPSDIRDVVNPKFRLDLTGVEVSVELDLIVSTEHRFQVPLLTIPPLLTNFEAPGISAGLFVDLVLNIEIAAEIDVRTGFRIVIPDGAFFEIDIDEDGVFDSDFSGIDSEAFPITIVNEGTAIDLKVGLLLKSRIGVTAGIKDIIPGDKELEPPFELSAGVEVGAHINLIEYVANLAPTDECLLDLTHEVNVNVGAFAKAGFEIGDELIGIDPTFTTTLFALPLPTLCALEKGGVVPKRRNPLPKASQCPAPPALDGPTRKRDGEEEQDEPQQPAGQVVAQTTALCPSGAKSCAEEEMTTMVYSKTVCAPAVANTGGCFAGAIETEAFITTTEKPKPTQAQDIDTNAQDNSSGDGDGDKPNSTPAMAGTRLGGSVIALAAALTAALLVL